MNILNYCQNKYTQLLSKRIYSNIVPFINFF